MAEDSSESSKEADGSRESQPAVIGGFDRYRSLADPSLMILVARDVVPPFRFKAGGWEFLQSSAELGSAMRTRIAKKGYFLFRANEDQTGGVELTDLPSPAHRAAIEGERASSTPPSQSPKRSARRVRHFDNSMPKRQ